MERCKYCGEPLTERTKFCPNCGKPRDAIDEAEFVVEEEPEAIPAAEDEPLDYVVVDAEPPKKKEPVIEDVSWQSVPPTEEPPRSASQRPASPQPPSSSQDASPTKPAPVRKKASKLSIWAFICSLTVILSGLGVILAIVDLVKGNKQAKHGLSKAALIIGGVFLLLAWIGNTFLKDDFLAPKEETLAEISAAGQEAVASGNRVVSIACGRGFLVGLRNNGRMALSKDTGWYQHDFLNVPDWTQITAIDVDADGQYILGLRFDGTVVASVPARYGIFATEDILEKQFQECGPCVSIEAGARTCFGVRKDGTVFVAFFDHDSRDDWESGKIEKVLQWKDIVRVEQIDSDVYGWKKDGSIVSTNAEAEARLKSLRKVVSLGGPYAEAILYSKGTVAHLWSEKDDPHFKPFPDWYGSQITQWKDIKKLLVFSLRAVGLKNDGTVVSAYQPGRYDSKTHVTYYGGNDYGESDVSTWTDIVDICSGFNVTIGLKKDGTLVFAGSSDWFDPAQWNQPVSIDVGQPTKAPAEAPKNAINLHNK